MPTEGLETGLAVALGALAACGLVFVGLAPAPAGAIDSATLLYFDSEGFNDDTTEIDVAAGETVTLDLEASTHGNPAGNGIVGLSYAVEYDPEVVTVTDVEHGSMLAGDGNATVDGAVEIDDEDGVVRVEQERVPPGNGSLGTGTTATLTLEVADDAPTTDATLEVTDSSATYPSDYAVNPIERDATLVVDGAADDSIPGFAPLPVLAGIGAALWLHARR